MGRYSTGILVTFLGLVGLSACSSEPANESPPIRNILFLMADDHAAYVMGAYGNATIRTPNLDRLAAQGVRFERAYANCPFCTPSRQSLITGKLPHACGVTLLQTPLAEEQVTIADHLKGFGFKTGAVGKMHFNSDLKHGFDYRIDGKEHDQYLAEHPARKPPEGVRFKPPWRPFQVPAREWLNADTLPGTGYPQPGDPDNQGLYDDDFTGTFFARRAIDFLTENRGDRMCLWLSFYEPHSPYNFPIEFSKKYDASEMPLPETGPEDDRWVPAIFRDLTEDDKRGIIRSYYSSVEYMDTNIGRTLDALQELGLADSTLVIYVGDHGYLLGHHRRFEKHMMWEEAVRVPLVIRDPRLGAKTVGAMVEMVDLVPTILDILEVPPIEGQQGKSLAPLLRGETDNHKEYVFSEYFHDNKAMVRSEEWKYIFTSGKKDLTLGYETGLGPSGRDQRLYNMLEDPKEFNDLADDPQYATVIHDMQTKMLEVFMTTDPRAAQLPDGLSAAAKLEWFLEPPEEQK